LKRGQNCDKYVVVDRILAEPQRGGGSSVGEGEAVYITTGAALPAGTDSVVMVERVEEVVSEDGSKVGRFWYW